jgi:TetR/AcrR family transcriptional repressor of bet genes
MTQSGRRNLAAERQTEILEAFKRCIALHGLGGSSMRVVAAEAGVSQPLLAHHFGSRAGLVKALVRHVVDGYLAEDRKLEARVRPDADVGELLDYMVSPAFALPHYDRLLDEVAGAAHRDPEVKREIQRLYRALEDSVVSLLSKALPEVAPERVREAAYTLHPLIEGVHLLQAQGFPEDRLRAAQRSARRLIESLQEKTGTEKEEE